MYQKKTKCNWCDRLDVMCVWHPNGPGTGEWVCYKCTHSPNDLLSDLVKSASKPVDAALAATTPAKK